MRELNVWGRLRLCYECRRALDERKHLQELQDKVPVRYLQARHKGKR